MSQVKILNKDETQLAQLGLTYDLIMDGEYATLDVEKKLKRKESYVKSASVEMAIQAYSTDLLEAYEIIESQKAYIANLEQDNEDMKADIADAVTAFEATQKQLQEILDSEDGLSATDIMLTRLEESINQFEAVKESDDAEIATLKSKLQELQENKLSVESLAEEVNAVLNDLRIYFEEEGLEYGE